MHARTRTHTRAAPPERRFDALTRAGVQWCVFAATHGTHGAAWKARCVGAGAGEDVGAGAPRWAQAVMANGFRTPQGALAVLGLHALPAWLWAGATCALGGGGSGAFARALGVPLSDGAWLVVACALAAGRLLAGAVEAWVLARHAGGMLAADAGERARARERP